MIRQRGVMIVRRRVLQKALYLLGRAMIAFPTKIQPPFPIQSMIGFGLAANLVGEAKATADSHQRSNACIQSRFVLDVMQAYRADYDIERSCGKIELFEPLHEETDGWHRRRFCLIDSRPSEGDHLRRRVYKAQRAPRKFRQKLEREVTSATSQLNNGLGIRWKAFQQPSNHLVISRNGASYQRVVRLGHRGKVAPRRRWQFLPHWTPLLCEIPRKLVAAFQNPHTNDQPFRGKIVETTIVLWTRFKIRS